MSRRSEREAIRVDLTDHPASRAWSHCRGSFPPPRFIEAIREDGLRHKPGIYRLGGVPAGDSCVIAKRNRREKVTHELVVLDQILPRASVTHLRLYGHWFEPEGDYGWLFIEDAGERPYQRDSPAHRELATRWLAEVHASAANVDALALLPTLGLSHHHEHLVRIRDNIRSCLENPALSDHHLATLRSILSHCSVIEAHWEQLESPVGNVPNTLVHADFKPRNLRLRTTSNGDELLVFDWGSSGHGPPAVDLTRLDLQTYFHTVRSRWPDLRMDQLTELKYRGDLFSLLAAVYWASSRLSDWWMRRTMSHMAIHNGRLASTLEDLGWMH